MKNFKSLLPFLLMVFALVGCDTDDLRNDVDELKNRVESLEAQVAAINENMNVLQVLVEGNKTIKSCTYDEATKTYKLVLSDDTQLELYQGEDGQANTPAITISDDNKWVINGVSTNVNATGVDAALPKFKLEDNTNYWMVDLDGDGTLYGYEYVLNEAGARVQAKAADDTSTSSNSFFESVKYNEAEGFLEVKLTSGGETYQLPVVPTLTCKINTENVDEYKDGVLTVGYGLYATLEVEVQGDNYFVTAPAGWTAVLGEVDPSSHKATLTVYAPKEETTSTQGRAATADNSTDLSLQVNKGGYWAVSKIQVNAITVIQSYKALYDKGETIMVGNIAVNRATYGKALEVSETDPIIDAADIPEGGVIFIQNGVNAIYNDESTAKYKNLIFIGDNSQKKSNIAFNRQIRMTPKDASNGLFLCYNMNVSVSDDLKNSDGSNSYLFSIQDDGAIEKVYFYDCFVTLPSIKQPLAYISSNLRSINDFSVISCKFDYPSGDTERFVLSLGGSTASYGSITFKNNIFYCREIDGLASNFKLFNGSSATISKVVLENNSFINLGAVAGTSATGLVYAKNLNEADINGNIFFNNGANVAYDYIVFRITNAITSGSSSNNYAYRNDGSTKAWKIFYSSGGKSCAWEGAADVTKLTDNPFDGGAFEPSTGTFVPNATYADYGAKFE